MNNRRQPFVRLPGQMPPMDVNHSMGNQPPMHHPFPGADIGAPFPPQIHPNLGTQTPAPPFDDRLRHIMPGTRAPAQHPFDSGARLATAPGHAMPRPGIGLPTFASASIPRPGVSGPIGAPSMPRPKEESSFRATGVKRALLIGVTYSGKNLRPGSVRDLTFMANLLTTRFGFHPRNLYLLTDALHNVPCATSGAPTRDNILAAMKWLVNGMRHGDSSVLYFTGKGAYKKDKSGDEKDGYDECIRPVDYKTAGLIVDDEMYKIMVQNVPRGARLTAFMDCDYSGTSLDLPYMHDPRKMGGGKLIVPNQSSIVGKLKITTGLAQDPEDSGDVLMFSACKDDEKVQIASAHDHGFCDSMTYALVCAVNSEPVLNKLTYRSVLKRTKEKLHKAGINEEPQFSCSHPFGLDNPFIM